MRQRNVPLGSDRGFTLIEVMVAAVVLMVGVLGTFVVIDGANRMSRENNARTSVTSLGREILEAARTLDYTDVASGRLVNELRASAKLAGEIQADGTWIIVRRNVPVTVQVTTCTFDDPLDGLGKPAPVNACAAAAKINDLEDSNPDDFRRVTLTLSWLRNAGGRTAPTGTACNSGGKLCVTQITQINNPGGGLGPRLKTFPDPFAMQVTDVTTTAVVFKATSTLADSVRWSVDDGNSSGLAEVDPAGTTGGAGFDWKWSWTIGTVKNVDDGTWTLDGVYTANAQPFDERGIPGEMRIATVALNRRVPLAPSGFDGGRSKVEGSGDGRVVELDWRPNPERDVLGYRIYRVEGSGSRTRVCPAATEGTAAFVTTTYCTAPDNLANGNTRYEVVAVDRPVLGDPSSAPRDGDVSFTIVVPLSSEQFEKPAITTAEVTIGEGRPRIAWSLPSNATTSYQPAFYRIYRDGVRIARTNDATRFFVDADYGSTTAHRYQVSAVDADYREGKLSDEVVTPG